MAQLQAATDLRTGTIVYTKGFYAVGDGGGAFWKVLDAGPEDQYFVYQCANHNGSSRFVSLIHDGTINMKQAGIRADGVQDLNHTYSGTTIAALNGTTRPFWVSDSGSEATNFAKLQKIVEARCNVYIPKGIYVFTGISYLRVRSGLSFIGESMSESKLIGLGFSNDGFPNEGRDLWFENFSMEGYTSFIPPGSPNPRKLKNNNESGFNANEHWHSGDYLPFSHRNGANRSGLDALIKINNSSVQENKNITVRRLTFRNCRDGVTFGTKTTTEATIRTRNILVEECVFEDIMFQPVGTNNVTNARVLNNSFDNVGMQACDFARGSIDCEFSGNLVTRASGMAKVEGAINTDPGFTRVLSDLFTIRDNVYKDPPSLTDWQYESKYVMDNVTGDGVVCGNFFEMGAPHEVAINTTIRQETLDDNVRITGNRFLTPTSTPSPRYGVVNVLYVQRQWLDMNGVRTSEYPSVGKNVVFENNTVVARMKTNGCFLTWESNATNVAVRNNLFVSSGAGFIDRFVQGYAANLEIAGNTLERVGFLLDAYPGALRLLDIKTILVADNRILSDYSINSAYLGHQLIRVAIDGGKKAERVIVRDNVTNRSRLLKVESKVIRIDVTGNVLQEDDGNAAAPFGCQPIAVGALVDDLSFEGNTVWFPNQSTYSGIISFITTNQRNVQRLIMENNKMTLSGQLATGTPSAGLKPDAFLFRNNKVFKVGSSNPTIDVNAAKGSVSFNLFDGSGGVTIKKYTF
jgi:hypothetical protein